MTLKHTLRWFLQIAIVVVFILIPMLSVWACGKLDEVGFEGTNVIMGISSCSPDWQILYGFAEFTWGLVWLSIPLIGLPALLYLGLVWFALRWVGKNV